MSAAAGTHQCERLRCPSARPPFGYGALYLLSCALIVAVAASVVAAAPPGAPRDPRRDDIADEEDMSPLTQGDLVCNLCEHYVAPAIVSTILQSEARHLPRESMENTLQRVLEETEAHLHQPVLHQYLMELLWSPHTMHRLAALQRTHHRYPHRAHLLEKLVDHVVCSCRAHVWETDRVFERMLERHAALEYHEQANSGDLGGPNPFASLDESEHDPFEAMAFPGGGGLSDQPPQPPARKEAVYGEMPQFGGLATGNERQGEEM